MQHCKYISPNEIDIIDYTGAVLLHGLQKNAKRINDNENKTCILKCLTNLIFKTDDDVHSSTS